MIKLYHERDVDGLALEASIKDIARNTLKILDEAYGEERDPLSDLGGFLVILESEDEIENLKDYQLDIIKDIPEYSDYVAGANDNWIVSLYLLSSDYSITVIMPMYLAPIEILVDWETLQDRQETYQV